MKLNTKDLWVWQFDQDGSVTQLIDKAKTAGCGVIVKVLDGVHYQATFDHHPDAIDSPLKAATIARRFEEAGVPCSFWANTTGQTSVDYEARAILETDRAWRPRTWFLDTEPYEYFFVGPYASPSFAQTLVNAVKGYSKANVADGASATLVVCPDARPWSVNANIDAFCSSAADAIAPQCYWRTFAGNETMYRRYGYPVDPNDPEAKIGPNFVVKTAFQFYSKYGKPILPIFQGDANADEMRAAIDVVRYFNTVKPDSVPEFSVWRAGVIPVDVPNVLSQYTPPGSVDSPTPVDPATEALKTQAALRGAAASLSGQLPDGNSVQLMQNVLDFFKSQQGK